MCAPRAARPLGVGGPVRSEQQARPATVMMSRRRGVGCLAAMVALGCALLPACKRDQPTSGPERAESKPSLGPVVVRPIPTVDFRGHGLRLNEGQLVAKVKGLLDHAGLFAEARPKQAVVAVNLEVLPLTEGSGEALEMGVKLRLRMTVRPEGAAPARFGEDSAALGQAPLEARDADQARAAFQRLAERTAGDLVAAYVGRQILWSGNGGQVAAALGSSDNEMRVEALRVIGARKMRDQVPAVLHLLADEDEGVRDAALGTLVALRERGAIKALAESRQMRDAREMRKVLDAIATLGGPEARDYLGFVAETHDDEEIRAMAKAAMDRLSRHPDEGRPTK